MKILVFGHHLVVGGTPLNGIELASALRDLHGHQVTLFATPGPMLDHVHAKGLDFIPAPEADTHPSPARMAALRRAVRQVKPDVLHVWDWFQCLDAYYSVHLPMRVPMVVTDMFMSLTRVLPKAPLTTFGIPELVDQALAAGRSRARTLLPPVDIHLNAPGTVDGQAFRHQFGIAESEIAIVTVSRLDPWMKSDSLHRTIDAVEVLGRSFPVRLVLVGDGGARGALEERALKVNAALGRKVVTFAGEMLDPRPAYQAADIVVGMGGSALRGMAFAKPVIIVGAAGFCAPFNRDTAASFLYRGIYGQGSKRPGNSGLVDDIQSLLPSEQTRQDVGGFARQFVVEHFSLESVSKNLSMFCQEAAAEQPQLSVAVLDGMRTAAIYMRERLFLRRSVLPTQNRQSRPQPGGAQA